MQAKEIPPEAERTGVEHGVSFPESDGKEGEVNRKPWAARGSRGKARHHEEGKVVVATWNGGL